MQWKEIVTDYLTFTRRERIGIIIVLTLIIIAILLPTIFTAKDATALNTPDTTWITAVKKLEQKEKPVDENGSYGNETTAYQYDPSKRNNYNKSAGELFYFDPNTLSKEGWEKLGLRDKTIQTIQNYLGKDGRFKKAEDLQRVYGLHKDEYERPAPFIKIQTETKGKTAESFSNKNSSAENNIPAKPSYRPLSVDINSADTSAFIALPGIGSKLAARIVNFRDKLGGFYSIEQVRETFGLPDSTFQTIKQYLKLENATVRKININSATVDVLKVHPYIKWNIANPIVAYRNEHGSFSSIEDIKKIMIITDDIYKKIVPYLTTQ
jgi:competence protein ComEA